MKKSTKSANKSNVISKKTECPITREQFKKKAKNLDLAEFFAGKSGEKKTFSTGSLGWGFNDKIKVEIDGEEVKCQVGLNITIVGSKELPEGKDDETEDEEEGDEE